MTAQDQFVDTQGRKVGSTGPPPVRVQSNARTTASAGILLLALFAAQFVTVLIGLPQRPTGRFGVGAWHELIGLAIIPPLLLKVASVGTRFARYYRRDEDFAAAGRPTSVLRLLGPLLLLDTAVLMTTGVLMFAAAGLTDTATRQIHTVSAYVWLVLVFVHLVGHRQDLRRHALRDLTRHGRRLLVGARARNVLVVGSLLVGVLLAAVMLPLVTG